MKDKLSDLINNELSYTNGWKIDDKDAQNNMEGKILLNCLKNR